jgi:hypothetical protein
MRGGKGKKRNGSVTVRARWSQRIGLAKTSGGRGRQGKARQEAIFVCNAMQLLIPSHLPHSFQSLLRGDGGSSPFFFFFGAAGLLGGLGLPTIGSANNPASVVSGGEVLANPFFHVPSPNVRLLHQVAR